MIRITYEKAVVSDLLNSSPDILAVFEFGQSPLTASGPRHVPVALEPLDPDNQVEIWRCRGPVKTGSWDCLNFAQGEQLSMGHIAIDLREVDSYRQASKIAYDRLNNYLQQSPHPWPLKIWNYIPAINAGAGDLENYRQFCLGRADSVMAEPGEGPPLPAATAIGTPAEEPALQVYFLSAALPGLNVENPRQVSAWRYPREYGPRSPLFSRGTILRTRDSFQFLISGTASVVGHRTHHEDQVTRQLSESVRNMRLLLKEGERLMGYSGVKLGRKASRFPAPAKSGGRRLHSTDDNGAHDPSGAVRSAHSPNRGRRFACGSNALLKVYLRDATELDPVRQQLAAEIEPEISRLFLRGDICRSNLLTEVDGIANFRHDRAAEGTQSNA